VVDASEAPKRIGSSGLILEDLPRAQVKLAQTPQGFLYRRILEAHQRAKTSAHLFLDDAEVYAAYFCGVFTVPGDRKNRKITFKEDLS
jgi:2-C-methyl-D-erythritol 4-phosphate cytidylyltransferase